MSEPLFRTKLQGRSVFLAASIPLAKRKKEFHRIPNCHIWITEAVIALTRSVLSHGGRLVMGAHPTISPLIAQIAGEYRRPAAVEGERSTGVEVGDATERHETAPIVIYQSRVFEGHVPEETLFLERHGYARIVWTDVVAQERFRPRLRSRPMAPKSVQLMREQMFQETRPDAMVCVGGMEGVIDEAKLFIESRRDAKIYTLASTGGAASLLSEMPSFAGQVRTIDREILDKIEILRREFPILGEREERMSDQRSESDTSRLDFPEPPPAVVYPLVMQTIVDELGEMPGASQSSV